MADRIIIDVRSFDAPLDADTVVLTGGDLALSPAATRRLGDAAKATLQRAAGLEAYSGKFKKLLSIVLPEGSACERLIAAGTARDDAEGGWLALGGVVAGALSRKRAASVLFDGAGTDAEAAADFALGMMLRAYSFDAYKTKKDKDEDATSTEPLRVALHVADVEAVKTALGSRKALAGGVGVARDLVNEPPNVVFPAAFAERARALSALGVEVEVLDKAALEKIGMRALLGVAQGSAFEPRVVVMHWKGAGDAQPVAFVGKGVTFDSGGVSIKPAANMEDMKGDMAGAACVVGLMHALAARKAKVNAVGLIGLVENMPDGAAQRPGDIVTSLSGQTIEIINTDAEGRLVLADVLWYAQDRFKPRYMVNLATLTGAIMVALGKEHAGLFSNDDALAGKIAAAGLETGEKVWRMPLGPAYDKLIDSRFADMKNSGGRIGGSITAAQFLQRYVNGTPWAHLDIAGTGMAAENSDTNRSWGPGWGVRLLDRLVANDGG